MISILLFACLSKYTMAVSCNTYPQSDPCELDAGGQCATRMFEMFTTSAGTICGYQKCVKDILPDGSVVGVLEIDEAFPTDLTSVSDATIADVISYCQLSCAKAEMIANGCGCPICSSDLAPCSDSEPACCGNVRYDDECSARTVCGAASLVSNTACIASTVGCPASGGVDYLNLVAENCCAANMDDCCVKTCADGSTIVGTFQTDAGLYCDYSQTTNGVGVCGQCAASAVCVRDNCEPLETFTCLDGTVITSDLDEQDQCGIDLDDCCIGACSDATGSFDGVYTEIECASAPCDPYVCECIEATTTTQAPETTTTEAAETTKTETEAAETTTTVTEADDETTTATEATETTKTETEDAETTSTATEAAETTTTATQVPDTTVVDVCAEPNAVWFPSGPPGSSAGIANQCNLCVCENDVEDCIEIFNEELGDAQKLSMARRLQGACDVDNPEVTACAITSIDLTQEVYDALAAGEEPSICSCDAFWCNPLGAGRGAANTWSVWVGVGVVMSLFAWM